MGTAATVEDTLRQALEYLRQRLRVDAAFLFGSQLTGETHEYSDIDLAVFSPDVDRMNLVERVNLRADLTVDCDTRLELHLFPSQALADARPTNFAGYILAHGKRLI